MLLESKQLIIDTDTHVTYEIHHNRVEGVVTRWTGHSFDTLATTNSFSHDSLGEVIADLLADAGYSDSCELVDAMGLYPVDLDD